MRRLLAKIVAAFGAVFVFITPASAQINSLTPEGMIKYTAQNPFDRFPDGRPKVPDALLKEFNNMSSEEVMGVGRGAGPAGARVTFVSGFQVLNPGRKLIGRAVTLQLMPTRPDVAGPDAEDWKKKGNATPLNHQSALDVLQAGDVIVIDAGGNINAGGIIGDNLAYYIWKKTGAGFVIDGAIRDLEGIASFGMAGYFRAAVPPAIQGLMVTGINVPVRIGNATVMPGDVVFGDREGGQLHSAAVGTGSHRQRQDHAHPRRMDPDEIRPEQVQIDGHLQQPERSRADQGIRGVPEAETGPGSIRTVSEG